ncbi:MAG: response regulator [Chitinivibrionales bacterium]|nr:response regulator [Chitinivibrionales bacterium]
MMSTGIDRRIIGLLGKLIRKLSRRTGLSLHVPDEFAGELQEELAKLNVRVARMLALIGGVLYPLFYFTGIDYLYTPSHHLAFLQVRLAVSLFCFGAYYALRRNAIAEHAQWVSFLILAVCGWGIGGMVRVLGYQSPYYAGLNLVYLCSMLVPWGMAKTLGTGLSIYAAYLVPILIWDLPQLDMKAFVSNNQFQLYTITVAAIVSGFQYSTRRRDILNRLTIAKQAKQLEDLDQYKREFIANITHELKTPLSIMIGNTDVILEKLTGGETDPELLRQHVQQIQQASFQLANHVDRIIAVAALDEPEVSMDLENYNYVGIVQRVFDLFKPKAEEENKEYVLKVPDNPLVVRLDTVRIEEVLTNLIQNAFKYTEPGARITVTVGSDGENVYTEVSDTGVGIPANRLDKVFDRLYQADDVLSRRHGGIGLGLYITKRNVELHGGGITVQSTQNKGTSFRFNLPLFADQTVEVRNKPYNGPDRRHTDRRTQPDRRAEERRKRFEYQQSMGIDDLARMSYTENLDLYEAQRPSAPSVLIVEDNPGMMKVMVEALKDEYNLFLARNGMIALEKLGVHGSEISLILSDIMMPGMSGFEFCERVMERDHWKRIPIIFVTALMSEEDQLRGYGLGATDYIIKPYNVRILKEKVHHWISRRQYELLLHGMSESLESRVQMVAQVKDIILHEIRNPLQIIMGANFFLERVAADGGEHTETASLREYIETLRGGVESLNAVIETSRDLEVAELNRQPERLSSLVSDALAQTQHLRAGICMDVDLAALETVAVMCERRMIIQVLVNVLRNATEAIDATGSRKNGKITLRHDVTTNRFVSLSVSDNGVGIDKATKDKLFRFKFTTKKDGTGVGLHLSKMILKLHEGTISVESEVGEGATFTLSLPLVGRPSRYHNPIITATAFPTRN